MKKKGRVRHVLDIQEKTPPAERKRIEGEKHVSEGQQKTPPAERRRKEGEDCRGPKVVSR